jgi:hypothetical protein
MIGTTNKSMAALSEAQFPRKMLRELGVQISEAVCEPVHIRLVDYALRCAESSKFQNYQTLLSAMVWRAVNRFPTPRDPMANSKSDIELLDDFDGQVKVAAPDFCLDGGQGRRHGNTTPYRRSLVHEGGDTLTIHQL